MDESKARAVLGKWIDEKDGSLHDIGAYINWIVGDSRVTIDGRFTADQLEAVARWMRSRA